MKVKSHGRIADKIYFKSEDQHGGISFWAQGSIYFYFNFLVIQLIHICKNDQRKI